MDSLKAQTHFLYGKVTAWVGYRERLSGEREGADRSSSSSSDPMPNELDVKSSSNWARRGLSDDKGSQSWPEKRYGGLFVLMFWWTLWRLGEPLLMFALHGSRRVTPLPADCSFSQTRDRNSRSSSAVAAIADRAA